MRRYMESNTAVAQSYRTCPYHFGTNTAKSWNDRAARYAKYRQSQPPRELIDYLASLTPAHELAWDVATGNGQAACELAKAYSHVIATDASEQQLKHAQIAPNVDYKQLPAEITEDQMVQSGFQPNSFDLITVSSAIQWLNLDLFWPVVERLLKKEGGIFACWAIQGSLPKFNSPAIDEVLTRFGASKKALGRCTCGNRPNRLQETMHFPFDDIMPPQQFSKTFEFTPETFVGRLTTYSDADVVLPEKLELLTEELADAWGPLPRKVSLPLTLRVGRMPKPLEAREKLFGRDNFLF